MPYEEYKKLHKYSEERQEEIDELQFVGSNTIQVEMLNYMKIWGRDFPEKDLPAEPAHHGQNYDWHLKISFG